MLVLGAPSSFAATSTTPYDFSRFGNPSPGPDGRYGDRMRAAGDLNADGVGDLWLGQYGFDAPPLENVGRVYAISGKDGSAIYQIDAPEPQNLPEGRGGFGWALSNVGDIDGDGRDDLLVGNPRHKVDTTPATPSTCGTPEPNDCNEDQGRAWLFSGAPEKPKTPLRTLDNPRPQGTPTNIAAFGYRLGKAGDLNGDGRSELLIGAPDNDGAAAGSEAATRPGGAAGCADTTPLPAGCRKSQGQAFIFDGATGATIRTLDIPAGDRYLEPSGVCTSDGDANGPASTLCGELGLSAQGPGDATGDGVPDQLVGAWSYSPRSAGGVCGAAEPNGCTEVAGAYYLFDGATGEVARRLDSPTPLRGGRFGLQEVAEGAPGDLNGDGRVELYGAAPQQQGPPQLDGGAPLPGEGRAWVFNGADGSVLFSLRDPTPGPSGNFGYALARTDYDADGHPDLYVGSHAGTYVFNGRDASVFKVLDLPAEEFADQPPGNTNIGRSVAAPGDLDGDCEPDYVAGSPGHDVAPAGVNEGRLYVFQSRGPSACPTTPDPPGPPLPTPSACPPGTSAGVSCQRSGNGLIITGTSGNDRIVGSPGDDAIRCGPGDDIVNGGGGGDTISCGAGNDRISGGPGNDRLGGEAGNDRAGGGPGNDRAGGGSGKDRLSGNSGNDRLDGGAASDRLSGNSGNDRLLGGRTGNDRLDGNSGNDRLVGGVGRDSLVAGTGRDRLSGGRGNDRLNTRDRRPGDVANCGESRRDRDRAAVDRGDRVRGCERVRRRR